MKGGKKTTTTSQNLDPAAAGMQKDVYDAARRAAGNYTAVGPNAATNQALAGWERFAGAGANGLAALSGDAGAAQSFMNPFQSQVIDQMNQEFGRAQGAVSSHVNSNATQAGAFGGSRHGVAEGIAQGQLANQHGMNIANTLQSGFNDSMNRAGQVANFGFGANAQMGNMGQYLRGIDMEMANPDAARLGLLSQGAQGSPHGYNQTTSTPMQKNAGAGFLGGAATGASIGSMIPGLGTAVGAGIGGLLGLF